MNIKKKTNFSYNVIFKNIFVKVLLRHPPFFRRCVAPPAKDFSTLKLHFLKVLHKSYLPVLAHGGLQVNNFEKFTFKVFFSRFFKKGTIYIVKKQIFFFLICFFFSEIEMFSCFQHNILVISSIESSLYFFMAAAKNVFLYRRTINFSQFSHTNSSLTTEGNQLNFFSKKLL